jgi:phosphoribosylformylglycinamidine cyclo-ligase
MEPRAVEEIVDGVAQACRDAGCALIGGETAELPGMYAPSEFDLVGFVVGSVRKDRVLTGAGTRAGDILLGLPSSGPHTNGFSLIRMVFGSDDDVAPLNERPAELDGLSIADALLAPHRSYLPGLRPALSMVRGLAHITGGGVHKNLPRSLPDGLAARIDRSTWEVPPVFKIIQRRGKVAADEMFRVFNMGVGMIAIVEAARAEDVQRLVPGAWRIGEVVPRDGGAPVVFA